MLQGDGGVGQQRHLFLKALLVFRQQGLLLLKVGSVFTPSAVGLLAVFAVVIILAVLCCCCGLTCCLFLLYGVFAKLFVHLFQEGRHVIQSLQVEGAVQAHLSVV